MRYYIFDSSFLIALMYVAEEKHHFAVQTFKRIFSHESIVIISDMVIRETVFILIQFGEEHEVIRRRINELSSLPEVIIHNGGDTLTTLKYVSRFYNLLCKSEKNQKP